MSSSIEVHPMMNQQWMGRPTVHTLESHLQASVLQSPQPTDEQGLLENGMEHASIDTSNQPQRGKYQLHSTHTNNSRDDSLLSKHSYQPNGYEAVPAAAFTPGLGVIHNGSTGYIDVVKPMPRPAPIPYHSYPHLTFRLPSWFVDSWTNDSSPSPDGDLSPSVALTSSPSVSPSAASPASAHSRDLEAPLERRDSRWHVSFRAMHVSDTAAVAALHDILFPVRYDARFYSDLLLPDRITILAFLEPCELPEPGPDGLTTIPEPLLIGLATGKFRELSGQCRRRHSGYIITLGVEPRFRKIGLGKFLLKHLICMIREAESRCESIFLHVLATNTSAIHMYRSCGFSTYEHLPGHYHISGVDHDALSLVKYINLKKHPYDEAMEQETQGWCTIM